MHRGITDLEAIRTVCSAVSRPVNVVMGLTGGSFSVDDLVAAGVRRISVGGGLSRAALGAFIRAAREIKEQGTFTLASEAAPHAEINRLMAGREASSEGTFR